jgi:predicted XRE-type DNA-binding protein
MLMKRSRNRSAFPTHPESTVAKAQSSRVWERTSEDQMIPKETLAKEIAGILKERKLTQIEAAYLAGDAPSQLSLIVSGKLRGFSVERMLRILARLGRDVDIVIKPAPDTRMGRIKVSKKGR